MVSAKQWERVQGYIRHGIEEGARLSSPAAKATPMASAGYFVRPTLFAGCHQ